MSPILMTFSSSIDNLAIIFSRKMQKSEVQEEGERKHKGSEGERKRKDEIFFAIVEKVRVEFQRN